MIPIGILGGGIGGLAAAIALHRIGREAVVFEQASRFARVGADINLTPNAVRALDGLGLGAALRETAARPRFRISRLWDTGEETSRLPMAEEAERLYGAPQLTMHRADLLAALEAALPAGTITLGRRAVAVEPHGDHIAIAFADGGEERVAALVGADGIHSVARTALHGKEHPRFTGVVAFRTVVPRALVEGVPNLDSFTKWWGPNPQSQIVTFPLNRGEDIFIFATIGQESWQHEGWTQPGSVDELRELYADYHPEARALLDACDAVLKTALWERDPLPFWSRGAVTLLGDSAHPMLPFMAQGACQAVEDAVVLARCVAEAPDIPAAFARYEATRLSRTARIQIGSRENAWLRAGGNADWLYGYDSWAVPLGLPQAA
jgi:salicylate hydroxylase